MPLARFALCLSFAALLAPLADAQTIDSALILTSPGIEHPLTAGNVTHVPVIVTLVVDKTAYLATNGIPIKYMLASAPNWASVTLTPSAAVLTLPTVPTPGASETLHATFDVAILGNATQDTVDVLQIVAVTQPSNLGRPASGSVQILLAFDAPPPPPPCPANATAPATRSQTETPGASRAAAPVTVQAASSAPVDASLVVAGFAMAGAGIGFVVHKRR